MLAQNGGEWGIFARLVEQSRRAKRPGVRFRTNADAEVAKSGLA
jgi:hypothetical protein